MKKMMLMLCVAILADLAPQASAVTVNDFLPRTYTNASGVLPYRLFKPANYNPTNKYPIVLFLHGAGERGTDNSRQLSVHPSSMVLADAPNQTKNPSFMVAPQCPQSGSWGDSVRNVQVFEMMNALMSEFSVDADRVYITGLSMGGFGSWYAITLNPQMYAAAAPIASSWDNYFPNIDISHMPVWSFYGAYDASPVATRAGVGNLRRVGCNIIYTDYAKGFHNVWDDAYGTPALLSWMYSQKRGTNPFVGPVTWITSPTSASSFGSTGTNLNLAGLASSFNGGAAFRVDWTNFSATVSSGLATRAGVNWSVSNIGLNPTRTNFILITAWDSTLNGILGGFTTFSDTLSVVVPPSITDQPSNQAANVGDNVVFSVLIPPYVHQPRFQWLYEGQPITGATTSSITLSNVQPAHAGNYSVMVSNPFGAVASSNAVLEINTPPVARCRQVIVNAADLCQADGSINDGSFDPDGDAIIIRQLPEGPYPLGTNVVTLIVTDSRGASNSCAGRVIVLDRVLPEIVCPADISVTNAHDQLTSTVTFAPSATDNCGSIRQLICDPPSGSAFGVGTHIVTCEATDNSGNSVRCTFRVTVLLGNLAPVPNIAVSPLAPFPGWTNLIVIAPDGCAARVEFDGSESFDPDDAAFHFAWCEATNLFSTNMVATRTLKVGSHEITLKLDDGFPLGISSTNVEVEVISGNDAAAILIDMVMHSGLTKKDQHPLLVTLKAAAASFERGQTKTACHQLRAFQKKVFAQISPEVPDLAEALIQSAQVIINAVENPPRHEPRHDRTRPFQHARDDHSKVDR